MDKNLKIRQEVLNEVNQSDLMRMRLNLFELVFTCLRIFTLPMKNRSFAYAALNTLFINFPQSFRKANRREKGEGIRDAEKISRAKH